MKNGKQDDDGNDIILRTTVYFQSAATALGSEPNFIVATAIVRFGMLIALQHPEYAQAYYRITLGMQPIADELEDEVVRSFIRSVPLHSVILGADNEQ